MAKIFAAVGSLGFVAWSWWIARVARHNILAALAAEPVFDVLPYIFYLSLFCFAMSLCALFFGGRRE